MILLCVSVALYFEPNIQLGIKKKKTLKEDYSDSECHTKFMILICMCTLLYNFTHTDNSCQLQIFLSNLPVKIEVFIKCNDINQLYKIFC